MFKECLFEMGSQLKLDMEIIIEEYSHYVYTVIQNITINQLNHEDIEDIMSEVFFLLWKNQSHIEINMKGYLATIARTCTYHYLKKKNNALEFKDDKIGKEDYLENIYVKDCLECLDEQEKKIFVLYYYKGYKVKEIAKKENLSSHNIKIKLYRIRKKIKETYQNGSNRYK